MEKQLPNNWVESKLGEILQLKNGFAFKSKNYLEEGIPVLRISEIKNEKISIDKAVFVKESVEYEKYIVEKGDILIAMSGATTGKYGFYDHNEKAYQNQRVGNLRLFSNELINKKFVYYLIGALKKEIEDKAYGGAQPNISSKLIENTKFNLPPLKEQQRIAQKLDELFAQLDEVKTRLETIPTLLKNFRQSVLNQAVTGKLTEEWRKGKDLEDWKKYLLGDLLNDSPKNGAYYPRTKYGRGTRIIRIDSFYDGELRHWAKVQKVEISKKDFEIYKLEKGNILINRVNSIEYLGKCMLVRNLPEETIFESNIMRLSVNNRIVSSEFLKTFLISLEGLKELRKNAKHAVNQASINQTDVKNVELIIPSDKEQQEIVKRVETLFSKADQIQQRYEALVQSIETLPQAILAKAFKGELVPQLSTDGDAKDLLEEINKLKKETKKVTKRIVKK